MREVRTHKCQSAESSPAAGARVGDVYARAGFAFWVSSPSGPGAAGAGRTASSCFAWAEVKS